MKVVTNTTKTFDLFGLSADQYALVQSVLKRTSRRRTAKNVSNGKVTSKRAGQSRAAGKSAKTAKAAAAKSTPTPTASTTSLICPVGGERINKRGAWQHIKKHGKEKGMSAEQARAEYEKAIA